jgi:hypothetical protein
MTTDDIDARVQAALRDDELGRTLAGADVDEAEVLVRSTLKAVDPRIELSGFGEKPRGIVRALEIEWRLAGAAHREVLPLPGASL